MKILIFGLPGSGKSTLAKEVTPMLNAVWLNADAVRQEYNDWDFTPEGRMRQAMRMRYLSDGVVKAGKIAIADFVCPTEKTRKEFEPDYTVWMDTIEQGRFEDTNKIFERPEFVNLHFTGWLPTNPDVFVHSIKTFLEKKGENNV